MYLSCMKSRKIKSFTDIDTDSLSQLKRNDVYEVLSEDSLLYFLLSIWGVGDTISDDLISKITQKAVSLRV